MASYGIQLNDSYEKLKKIEQPIEIRSSKMVDWIGAIVFVLSFVMLARMLKLAEKSSAAFSVARHSIGVIQCRSMATDAKEIALQRDARELFQTFFVLAFGTFTAILPSVGLLWIGNHVGFISLSSVFEIVHSPIFLAGSGIVALLLALMGLSKVPGRNGFSALDRALHRIGFHSYSAQAALADLEDRILSKELALYSVERPVFITALPRAGTTLLLDCFANLPDFASHCYRDLPFVLIPYLWSQFSSPFRHTGGLRARAHGDGMLIDYDSVEALEEVVWTTFWGAHYQQDRILPWKSQQAPEFAKFFRNHMRKIIILRRGVKTSTARYVSKNNLNIARILLLRRLFPDAIIIILFREPIQHAASLLRQHRNFLRIHEEDRFALEYMKAIGHYEFGKSLRPIDFDGWLDVCKSRDTDNLAFWLEYWISTYQHLLTDSASSPLFLSFDRLCSHPEQAMRVLADTIETRHPDALLAAAMRIQVPKPWEVDSREISSGLIEEAMRVYDRLTELALN